MPTPESFEEYSELVSRQLRWKKAHPVIEREIESHLCDQRDALMKTGMDEVSANRESIRQMGDAVEIGTALDRVHRPKPAWELFTLTVLLALIGIFINIFLIQDSNAPWQPVYSAAAVLLGVGCMLGAYFLDFTIIGKHSLAVCFGLSLIFVLLYFLLGQTVNGKRYYAQYALLLFPLAFAALLYYLRGRRYLGMLLALAGVILLSICCFLVPSVIGFAITILSAFVLVIIAAAEDWFLIGRMRSLAFIGTLSLAVAMLLTYLILQNPFISERLSAVFNPWIDPLGRGWQHVVVRELINGAQFVGQGHTGEYSTGISLAYTNFLLTRLIHNVGWIAFVVIMAVFTAFLFCGFRLCFKQKNMLGKLVSLAVMLTLTFQMIFYVAMNLGFGFIQSISLPLVSYGKTATFVNMALIGVMLSAFRSGSLVKDTKPIDTLVKDTKLRSETNRAKRVRWRNGELTISFKRHIAS